MRWRTQSFVCFVWTRVEWRWVCASFLMHAVEGLKEHVYFVWTWFASVWLTLGSDLCVLRICPNMWHEALPNIDKVVCLVGPLVLWCCNCLMLWATEQIPCVLQLPLPLPHAYTWIPLTICLSQANIYYGSNYKQAIAHMSKHTHLSSPLSSLCVL